MRRGLAACAATLGLALAAAPAPAEGGDDIVALKDGRVVQGVPLKVSERFVVASYKNGDVYIPMDLVEDYVIGGVVPDPPDEESKAQRANGLVSYKGKWVKPEVRDKLVKKAIEDRKKEIEDVKAHSEWRNRYKFEGKYFKFESTLTPAQNEHYAALLDAYFEVFKKDWNITIPKEFPKKLNVCVYPTYDDFLKGAGADRGTLAYYKFVPMPDRDLNFFNDRSDTRMTETVMFHECNHYLVDLFSQGLRYPHWLGESMAEYYGGCVYDERTKTVKVGQIQEGRLAEVREDIQHGKQMTIRNLVIKTPQYEDYYWGWSFTHFMMETPAYQKKYRQFFIDLARAPDVKRKPWGGPMNFTVVDADEVMRVFKKRLGLSDDAAIDALEREWYQYIFNLKATSVRGYEEAGIQAFWNGRQRFEAPRLLKLAIEKGSKVPKIFVFYSRCLRAKGPEGLPEALETMKAALLIDPLEADAWAEQGFVLQLMGQKDAGKKLVDLAYELDPSGYFVDYQTLLANARIRQVRRFVSSGAAWTFALAAAFAVVAPDALVGPPSALAEDAPADPVREARRLADEAKPFEQTAGDPDADNAEKRTARKKAFDLLKKAVGLLDAYLVAHPAEEEKNDALYCDIASRIFWIKKMAAVDEFTESGSVPVPPPTAGPGAGVKPPEKPAPPTAGAALADIEAYAAKHKGDVPGLYEKYQDFLAKFPDPATPEYAKAMAEVATLGARLKDVYRVIHDDDPDSVKNVDGAQIEKLLPQLVEDLEKGVSEVRERAAKFLGALGSGKAADPLMKALKREKSGPVCDAACDSLAKIGGRRVCERLLLVGKDEELSTAVVDILVKILAKGGAEGRIAGEALGGYVAFLAVERRGPVFESLEAAGPIGALGVARGIEYAPPEDTAKLIDKLPEADDPRVVTYLGRFLLTNAPGDRAEFAAASRRAIEKIGKRGVRYLIPHLDSPATAVWTAEMLRRITGQKLKDDKRKTWEAWFRMNRKALEGK